MKSFFKIVLICWYLFLTIGYSVATHFCGDSVDEVKLVSVVDQSGPENCCDGELPMNCCDTQVESFKITDLHQSKTLTLSLNSDFEEVFLFSELYTPNNNIGYSKVISEYRLASTKSIYIQNCTLLI